MTGMTGNTTGVVGIKVAGQRYGLMLAQVRDVVAPVRITIVPGGPRRLIGLFNHRGHIVPLYDLAELVGLPPCARGEPLAVVCAAGARTVAVAVDAVEEATPPAASSDLTCLDIFSLLDTPHSRAA